MRSTEADAVEQSRVSEYRKWLALTTVTGLTLFVVSVFLFMLQYVAAGFATLAGAVVGGVVVWVSDRRTP
jgi:uncharacterized membrane protein